MPISINMPRGNQESDLDSILKAVNIAKSIYGIATAGDENKLAREQAAAKKAEAERLASGIMNKGEENKVWQSGKFAPANEGDEGAIQLGMRPDKTPILGKKLEPPGFGLQMQKFAESERRYQTQQSQRIEDKKNEILDDYNKKITKAKEALDTVERAAAQFDPKNPASVNNARVAISRGMGNVGAQSDQDFERVVGSRALVDKMKRWWNEQITGENATEEDIKDLESIMRAVSQAAKKQMKREAETIAGQKAKIYRDFDQNDILDMLSVESQIADITNNARSSTSPAKGIVGLGENIFEPKQPQPSFNLIPKANASQDPNTPFDPDSYLRGR